MATQEENQQMYLGYFASIMLALLAATWFASLLAEKIAMGFNMPVGLTEGRLTAGFFFMICFANPAALVVHRHRRIRLIPAAIFGFAFGWFLQVFATEVYVGDGLARFFMIVVAAMGLPIMFLRDLFEEVRRTQTGRLWNLWFKWSRAINRTHERIIFMVLMVLGFLGFVAFTNTLEQTLLGLGVVVATMTGFAAFQSAKADDDLVDRRQMDFWEEDPLAELGELDELDGSRKELHLLMGTVLPGAVFFGGLTWAASQMIPKVFPNLATFPSNPAGNIVAAVEIGAVGLGLVMAGVALSALAGFGMLQVIGHYARWSPERISASRRSLMKRFSLRPMKRG